MALLTACPCVYLEGQGAKQQILSRYRAEQASVQNQQKWHRSQKKKKERRSWDGGGLHSGLQGKHKEQAAQIARHVWDLPSKCTEGSQLSNQLAEIDVLEMPELSECSINLINEWRQKVCFFHFFNMNLLIRIV